MDDVRKNHQLLIWYGSQWFNARGIPRIRRRLTQVPAALKRVASREKLSPLADTTNEGQGLNDVAGAHTETVRRVAT